MNQLGNILAKDTRFEKVGFLSNSSGDGYRCRICIWALKKENLLTNSIDLYLNMKNCPCYGTYYGRTPRHEIDFKPH